MKKTNFITYVFLPLLSFGSFANSVTTTSTDTSSGSSWISKLAPSRVSYFSVFSGPSLGGQGDRVDENGKVQEGSISTWNQVSFGWKINDKFRFVANPRFSINHNSDSEETLEVENPVVGVSATWYKKDKLIIGGGLNTILPTFRKESTRDAGILFNPGGFQYLDYQLTSALSLGTWLWARAYFYDGTADDTNNRFSFFLAPLATYTFTDSVSASVYYQIDGEQSKRSRLIFENESRHVGVMSSIKINKFLTLQPLVTFFENNGFDVSKANFNLWLSGRLF